MASPTLFSSPTVELIDCVDVLIVAMTSPGRTQADENREHFVVVRRHADGLDQARPVRGWLVEIVVITAWVVRLITETPPPLPALAT